MKLRILCFFMLLSVISVPAQREITLEDVWQNGKFQTRVVPDFRFLRDGKHYSQREGNRILEYDLVTGRSTNVLFDGAAHKLTSIDGYSFSKDESKILIRTDSEKIYRHSTKDYFWVHDRSTDQSIPLYVPAKQQHATFSPDGSRVAFVSGNNLFVKDLSTDNINQITYDGKVNEIINGAGDWVYEEELKFVKAFTWSPDGSKIAYARFDESRVREFTMMKYNDDLYPDHVTFKYPKVGEVNSVVSVKIYDVDRGRTKIVNLGSEEDIYIPRIKWFPNSEDLCVFRLNRHQNHLELLSVKARSGKARLILEEKNDYYIDIHDGLTFLPDGKQFIWISESDGYNHLYLYDIRGRKIRQITTGNFDVTEYYGYDSASGLVYYQAAARSPLQREVYAVDLQRRRTMTIADGMGFQDAQFSSTYDYYVLTSSDVNTPASYTVFQKDGSYVRTLEKNDGLKATIGIYD
ncbi:MAG: DPP IV N-terminal domain-containing protein, partial [Saprospiraceae bacterium]|nr:DPP IV N-terminal domain-containing protein [Saprospiraceae bacterium]